MNSKKKAKTTPVRPFVKDLPPGENALTNTPASEYVPLYGRVPPAMKEHLECRGATLWPDRRQVLFPYLKVLIAKDMDQCAKLAPQARGARKTTGAGEN